MTCSTKKSAIIASKMRPILHQQNLAKTRAAERLVPISKSVKGKRRVTGSPTVASKRTAEAERYENFRQIISCRDQSWKDQVTIFGKWSSLRNPKQHTSFKSGAHVAEEQLMKNSAIIIILVSPLSLRTWRPIGSWIGCARIINAFQNAVVFIVHSLYLLRD